MVVSDDGDDDLAGGGSEGLVLLRNDGPQSEWAVSTVPGIFSHEIVAGDWDGDGLDDLALLDSTRGTLSVLLNRTPPPSSPDENRDRVPDECAPDRARFLRGDCDADGRVDLVDAVCILDRLFAGGAAECRAALDTNADADATVTDAVFLLEFLFAGGPAPVEPFPDCGSDVDGELGCANPPACR